MSWNWPKIDLKTCLRGRTHVRIKGQNLNFYLETHATPHNIHATPHNIYFIRLRILPRILGTLYWRVDDPLAWIVGQEDVMSVYTSNFVQQFEILFGSNIVPL